MIALLLAAAVSAGEHDLAALVVLGPKGAPSPVPRAAMIEATDRVLRGRTSLALRSAEQLGLDEAAMSACPREVRLGCIVDHVAARTGAAVIVVASVVPLGEARHRVQLTLVDVAVARRELDRLGSGGDRAAAEDAIYAEAIDGEPEQLDATDRAAIGAHVARFLDTAIARLAERPRWLEPSSSLVVRGLLAPTELRIDGVAKAALDPPAGEVRDLRPGRRTLELSSGAARQTIDVVLPPGGSATVTAALEGAAPAGEGARDGLFIAGLAGAGVGAVAAIVSGVAASSVTRRCVARPADVGEASCSGLGWPGFGVDGDALPALSSDRVNSGPPLMIVGAGLLGFGAALAILEGPLRDGERSLLLDLAIAAGAAALGVGVSAALAP